MNSGYYNFVTNDYDAIEDWENVEFISQHRPEMGARPPSVLYCNDLHMRPLEAFINVLDKLTHQEPTYPVPPIEGEEKS